MLCNWTVLKWSVKLVIWEKKYTGNLQFRNGSKKNQKGLPLFIANISHLIYSEITRLIVTKICMNEVQKVTYKRTSFCFHWTKNMTAICNFCFRLFNLKHLLWNICTLPDGTKFGRNYIWKVLILFWSVKQYGCQRQFTFLMCTKFFWKVQLMYNKIVLLCSLQIHHFVLIWQKHYLNILSESIYSIDL